ncbi:MAG: dolichyl-phosphate-mannose--protein mannosyltransferase [Acidobacteria bacterium]|nr:MAG: dolichyl-phosphate-mannose--protein mannosyltransferase [Acidobacteriota bacterium]
MTERSRLVTDWLLLAGFCAFLFFYGLSYFGLIGADEPRYAQIAREMLARHDWITPTLGGTPWLEKPALYYWQAMLAYGIFGVSDWAARLPSAVDATLMVFAVYFFLRRFRPGFELDGALITASLAGVIGFARAASMEMPLAAACAIALLAWFDWYESGSKRYLALFYGFLGFGMLAKGPLAPFLAAVIIVVFAVVIRNIAAVVRTLWVPGIVLYFAVTLPWYVTVQVRNPEFFHVFFLQHNLARFATNLFHHAEPVWYFVPVLLLGLLPWTMFVVAAAVETVRAWWEQRPALCSGESLNVFLAIWILVPLLFFSFSQSKLPGYILPALPAGALLVAEYVRSRIAENARSDIFLAALHSIVAAAPIVPAMMLPFIVFQHRIPWGRWAAVSIAFSAVLAIGITMTLRAHAGIRMLRLITLVPVVLCVAAILRLGAPSLDATLSARLLAEQITKADSQRLPLAVLLVSRETEYGLQFYRNQNIARYELGQVPSGEHLLVAPEGLQRNVEKRVTGRRVAYLGSFAVQGLDYYWVGESTQHAATAIQPDSGPKE